MSPTSCSLAILVAGMLVFLGGCGDTQHSDSIGFVVEQGGVTGDRGSGPVQCHLEVMQRKGDVFAKLMFRNVGCDTISIEKRFLLATPQLDGAAFFEVRRDGEKIPYTGLMVKRPAPTAEDLYLLESGVGISVEVSLSRFFDLTPPGIYSISYTALGQVHETEEMVEIRSNAVEITIRAM